MASEYTPSEMMAAVAARLTDDEVKQLAEYAAGLKAN